MKKILKVFVFGAIVAKKMAKQGNSGQNTCNLDMYQAIGTLQRDVGCNG